MKHYQIEKMSDYDKEIKIKRNDAADVVIDAYKKRTVKKIDNDYKVIGEYRKSKNREVIGNALFENKETGSSFSLDIYEEGEFSKWLYKTSAISKVADLNAYITHKKRRLLLPFFLLASATGGGYMIADAILNHPEPIKVEYVQSEINPTPKPNKPAEEIKKSTEDKNDDVVQDIVEMPAQLKPIIPIAPINPVKPIPNVPVVPTTPVTPNVPSVPNVPSAPEVPINPGIPNNEFHHIYTKNDFGEITDSTQIKKGETIRIEYDVIEDYEFENVTINDKIIDVTFDKDSGKGSFEVDGNGDKNIEVNAKRKVFMIDTKIDHGFITPFTVVVSGHEVNIEFEIHNGYELNEVLIDGKAVKPTSYNKDTKKGYVTVKPKANMEVEVTSNAKTVIPNKNKYTVTTLNEFGTITKFDEKVVDGSKIKVDFNTTELNRLDNVPALKEVLINNKSIPVENIDDFNGIKGSFELTILEDTNIELIFYEDYKYTLINNFGYANGVEKIYNGTTLEKHPLKAQFDFDNNKYEFKYLIVNGIKMEPTSMKIENEGSSLFSTVTYESFIKQDSVVEFHATKRPEKKTFKVTTNNESGNITPSFEAKEGDTVKIEFDINKNYTYKYTLNDWQTINNVTFDEKTGKGYFEIVVDSNKDIRIYAEQKTYYISSTIENGYLYGGQDNIYLLAGNAANVNFQLIDGYEVDEIFVDGIPIDSYTFDKTTSRGVVTFTPEADAKVVIKGKLNQMYKIITTNNFGNITAPKKGSLNDEVEITFDLNEHYTFKNVTVNNEVIDVNFNELTRTGSFKIKVTKEMEVVINANNAIYMISTSIDYGTITPYMSATFGSTPKIEFTIDFDKVLDKILVDGVETETTYYNEVTKTGYIIVEPFSDMLIEVITK